MINIMPVIELFAVVMCCFMAVGCAYGAFCMVSDFIKRIIR